MANTILTPDVITREALRVLHEKLTFVGAINKQYDSSFAKSGAKIGDTLRIRKPAQFHIRRGINMDSPVQDYVEQTVPLTVQDIVGVDLEFGELDLTLDLDDFSSRIIEPAMSRIAADIEQDVLRTAQGQSLVTAASAADLWKSILTSQAYLDNLTTPRDNNRCVLADTMMQVDLVDTLKGLFQDSSAISSQYREGIMGRTAGADFYQSSYIPVTEFSAEPTYSIVSFSEGNPDVGSNAGASMVITATVPGIIVKGQVFELNNANSDAWAVQPETKKQFPGQKVYVTAQADVVIPGAGDVVVPIAAPIISSSADARQNISDTPIVADALAPGLSKSLVFHKDFMTFATADLTLPKGTDMASRQTFEGISIAMVRDFNIADRSYPVRFDVLYGTKVIRPEYGASVLKGY
jgi:hypothetical protein